MYKIAPPAVEKMTHSVISEYAGNMNKSSLKEVACPVVSDKEKSDQECKRD